MYFFCFKFEKGKVRKTLETVRQIKKRREENTKKWKENAKERRMARKTFFVFKSTVMHRFCMEKNGSKWKQDIWNWLNEWKTSSLLCVQWRNREKVQKVFWFCNKFNFSLLWFLFVSLFLFIHHVMWTQ